MEPLPGGCEVAGDVHFDSHPIGVVHLHQWDPAGLLPTQMGMAID